MEKAESASAVLVLERNDVDDIKIRDLFVHVDKRPQEILRYGKTLSIPLEPGQHHIKVGNGVAVQEVDVIVEADESIRFHVANLFLDRVFSPFLFILGGSVLAKVRLRKEAA